MFYEVIPEGRVEELTYDFDGDSLLPGMIVLVPVGRRIVPGVVIKKVAQPSFKTKSILKVLYSKPLPKHLLATIRFLHEYYLAPSGQAVSLILPKGVEKKRRKTEQMFGLSSGRGSDSAFSDVGLEFSSTSYTGRPGKVALTGNFLGAVRNIGVENSNQFKHQKKQIPSPVHIENTEQKGFSPEIPLNPAQKKALEGLGKGLGGSKLLYGVTGSGKTNIYLRMALDAFKRHLSSIILVPEIALTSQFVRVFEEIFGENIVLIHSKQTEAERHLVFNSLLETDNPKIVIGPRSALFAPLSNIGLIVIDEEHENTYYQENPPRYSTVRVASFMAKSLDIPLILGSATPTIEDFYLALNRDSLVKLENKAIKTAVKPEIKVIDFKERENFTKNRYFSNSLLEAISKNIEKGRQTLIFHNRRGSASLTICEECGEEVLCPNCFLPLTLHADEYVLHCHTCGFSEKVPTNCPKCGHLGMIHKGFGTKLLESELKKLFPKAKVKRFDADNKKGEGLEAVYNEVKSGDFDILVGTQTLAKGLDLPKLATVGVVQADAGLSLPDYMAEERTFQLLTQVIGRVGRGHLLDTNVFIQTFRPEHQIFKYVTSEDYLGFYEYMVRKRKKSGFPPFKFVMKLEITMKTEAIVIRKIRDLAAKIGRDKRLSVSPPMPAFHERTARGYTWQIIVRSRSRKALLEASLGLDSSFKVILDSPGLL